MKTIIYSSPTCPKCTLLKTFLKRKGVEFVEKNIMEEENRKELTELGYMSIPVMVNGGQVLEGFVLNSVIAFLDDLAKKSTGEEK